MIGSDGTAAFAPSRMHASDRCAIEKALSFQTVFGYRRTLVGLSTEVDALARSGPDLVAFLAFPTDRPRFQFEWNSPRSLVVGKKLYVGNLSYGVSDSALEQLFSQFGTVQSAQVIQDRATGRSKGFGFVEMDNDAQAQAAIEGLHERELDGRRLTVNEARPREERGGGGGGGYGGGGGGGGRGGRGGGGGGYGGGGGGGGYGGGGGGGRRY